MEEGARVPSGEDESDVPSLPRTLRGQAGFQMPSPSAPSIHVKRKPHCQVETLASHRLCRVSLISAKGWDRVWGLSLESRSLSLGPLKLSVLSPCHSTRQCQTHSTGL